MGRPLIHNGCSSIRPFLIKNFVRYEKLIGFFKDILKLFLMKMFYISGGTDPITVTIKGDRKIFYPPSWGYRKIILKPSHQLVLDWVYGIRGSDVSKNLWILTTGELVYFVATTVVIYNRLKETQKHYRYVGQEKHALKK